MKWIPKWIWWWLKNTVLLWAKLEQVAISIAIAIISIDLFGQKYSKFQHTTVEWIIFIMILCCNFWSLSATGHYILLFFMWKSSFVIQLPFCSTEEWMSGLLEWYEGR